MAEEKGNILKSGLAGAATGSALGPWGAAAGAVIGVGSQLLKNTWAKRESAKRDALNQQRAINNLEYYNMSTGDYMNRSEVKAVVNKGKDVWREQLQNADAKGTAIGSTEAAKSAMKQEYNDTMGNMYSNIASDASTRKDAATERYYNQSDKLIQEQIAESKARDGEVTKAASDATQAGLELINVAGTAIASKKNGASGQQIAENIAHQNEVLNKAKNFKINS